MCAALPGSSPPNGASTLSRDELLVKLREVTGRRVKAEDFKAVRTVGDVLDALEKLMATDAVIPD